ncbi:MAG: DNA repair protein RecO [Patescibacteria group bacterium]
MHHIYHTEGIILGSRNFGEDGKYFYVFTRELGMVTARASGVRKISSKLRYILQDYSYVKIDLVQGRDFWRIGSAAPTGKLEDLSRNLEVFKIVSNIARLLRRLLPGEGSNEPLFLEILDGFSALEQVGSGGEMQNSEIIIVLKVLHHLGYIGESKINELVSGVTERRGEILALINQTLKETHL